MPLGGSEPAEGRGRRATHGKGSESGLPRARRPASSLLPASGSRSSQAGSAR